MIVVTYKKKKNCYCKKKKKLARIYTMRTSFDAYIYFNIDDNIYISEKIYTRYKSLWYNFCIVINNIIIIFV